MNPETPSSSDRTDGFNLRNSVEFSQQNLRDFQWNPSSARSFEAFAQAYESYINTISGYISDAALVKGTGTFKPLTKEGFDRKEVVQGLIYDAFKRQTALTELKCIIDPGKEGCSGARRRERGRRPQEREGQDGDRMSSGRNRERRPSERDGGRERERRPNMGDEEQQDGQEEWGQEEWGGDWNDDEGWQGVQWEQPARNLRFMKRQVYRL